MCLSSTITEIFSVDLESGLGVVQGHWKWWSYTALYWSAVV